MNTYFCQALQDGMETVCIVNADNTEQAYEALKEHWWTIEKKSWYLHLVDRTVPLVNINRRAIK